MSMELSTFGDHVAGLPPGVEVAGVVPKMGIGDKVLRLATLSFCTGDHVLGSAPNIGFTG